LKLSFQTNGDNLQQAGNYTLTVSLTNNGAKTPNIS
jgi:hypothetical protein